MDALLSHDTGSFFLYLYKYDIYMIHMEVIVQHNNVLVIALKQSKDRHLPSTSKQIKQHTHI